MNQPLVPPNVTDADEDVEPLRADIQKRQRLLYELVRHSLDQGMHTAEAFLNEFGPQTLMQALEKLPKLRGKFLHAIGNTNRSVCRQASTGWAAETLRIVHENNTKDAATIVKHLPLEHLVAELDPSLVWRFFSDGILQQSEHRIIAATKHLLVRAWASELLTPEALLKRLPIKAILESLSDADEERLLVMQRAHTLSGTPFPAKEWFNAVSLADVVQRVRPKTLWETIIIPLAQEWDLFTGGMEEAMARVTVRPTKTSSLAGTPAPAASPASNQSPSKPPPAPSSLRPSSLETVPADADEPIEIQDPEIVSVTLNPAPDTMNGLGVPEPGDASTPASVSSPPSSVAPGAPNKNGGGPELIDTNDGHLHLSSR